MAKSKIAENVSKIVEIAFFCNVIIFYCFLELLETPTEFFEKNLILGQCYTFVHQNCATDHLFSVFGNFTNLYRLSYNWFNSACPN